MGGDIVKSVVKLLSISVAKVVRLFKFLSKINPFVALGVFAVGWLFMRSMKNNLMYLTLEQMILKNC